MACFTKTQQSNGTYCEFDKYVTKSKFFALNTLDQSHRNSVRAQYVCDKSENARVCAKWQWNALDWCYWIALSASPVVQSIKHSLVRFTVISHTSVRSRYRSISTYHQRKSSYYTVDTIFRLYWRQYSRGPQKERHLAFMAALHHVFCLHAIHGNARLATTSPREERSHIASINFCDIIRYGWW